MFQMAAQMRPARQWGISWRTYHGSRTALCRRRACSHRRTRWASPCTCRHCGTASRSCHSALGSLAARPASPGRVPPDPAPRHSAAETGYSPEIPSAGSRSRLKGKYYESKHVPGCFIKVLKTTGNGSLTRDGALWRAANIG